MATRLPNKNTDPEIKNIAKTCAIKLLVIILFIVIILVVSAIKIFK